MSSSSNTYPTNAAGDFFDLTAPETSLNSSTDLAMSTDYDIEALNAKCAQVTRFTLNDEDRKKFREHLEIQCRLDEEKLDLPRLMNDILQAAYNSFDEQLGAAIQERCKGRGLRSKQKKELCGKFLIHLNAKMTALQNDLQQALLAPLKHNLKGMLEIVDTLDRTHAYDNTDAVKPYKEKYLRVLIRNAEMKKLNEKLLDRLSEMHGIDKAELRKMAEDRAKKENEGSDDNC